MEVGEPAGFRIRINKRRQCSAGKPGGRQLPPVWDSRVQRAGQQHDGEAIGSDAATSLRTKSMDTLGQPLVGRSWPLALLSHLQIMAGPICSQSSTFQECGACSERNICSIYLGTLSGTPPIAIAVPVILLQEQAGLVLFTVYVQIFRRQNISRKSFSEEIPHICTETSEWWRTLGCFC